jgi:hypothetical protein
MVSEPTVAFGSVNEGAGLPDFQRSGLVVAVRVVELVGLASGIESRAWTRGPGTVVEWMAV